MVKIDLPYFVKEVLFQLNSYGYEAYLVGGCVRDYLLGIIPNDFDITTNATPEQMKKCFEKHHILDIGIKHGTISVEIDKNIVEVTTYRVDGVYFDNRHPENVVFTSCLEEDIYRRDFTINSLCYNEKNGLVDKVEGVRDIEQKLIRCVGEADKRFKEDALRILRALRFSSTLGFSIEKSTSDSIHKNKNLIKNISVERIFSEITKLLCGDNVEKVLLEYSDVFCVVFPELDECVGFEQKSKYHCYDVYEHIVKTVSSVKNEKNLRIAALFHDIGKPEKFFIDEENVGHFYGHPKASKVIANNILHRYNVDNNSIKEIVALVEYHDREIEPTLKSVKRFASKTSIDFVRKLIEIKRADASAHAKPYRDRNEYCNTILSLLDRIESSNDCISIKSLDIDGNDLIELGYNGEEIGIKLKEILKLVIDVKIDNKREIILNYLKKKD